MRWRKGRRKGKVVVMEVLVVVLGVDGFRMQWW